MYTIIDYKDLQGEYILIDLRSPGEYKAFTIPGAVNIPIFNDEERKHIGTVYVQENKEKAKKIGIEYVSKRLPEMFDDISELKAKHRNLVLFCERGGMRSSSIWALLNSLGVKALKLNGGYKGYRALVNEDLPQLSASVKYVVFHGLTGTGKTELLRILKARGADVLDLEKAANHRGSLLGAVGLGAPVTQRHFEAEVFESLRNRQADYVFVESESPRIGNIVVPSYIMKNIAEGFHILLESGIEARVKRLVDDYTSAENAESEILMALEKLRKYMSKEDVDKYTQWILEGKFEATAEELIIKYYDPLYEKSQKRYNYGLTINTEDMEAAGDAIIQWLEKLKAESSCNELESSSIEVKSATNVAE